MVKQWDSETVRWWDDKNCNGDIVVVRYWDCEIGGDGEGMVDMVAMDMVDMNMLDIDMVDMDLVDMDMVDMDGEMVRW